MKILQRLIKSVIQFRITRFALVYAASKAIGNCSVAACHAAFAMTDHEPELIAHPAPDCIAWWLELRQIGLAPVQPPVGSTVAAEST
jgi:hypothetical protein